MSSSENSNKELVAPSMFPFPFKPYPSQVQFMSAVFETLEKGGLGVFESPTGTGKSMSLICGSLTWMAAHETRIANATKAEVAAAAAAAAVPNADGGHSNSGGGGAAAKAAGKVKAEVEPDWVVEHAAKCSDAKKLKETEKHMERELRFKRMREDLTKRRAKAVVRNVRRRTTPAQWLEQVLVGTETAEESMPVDPDEAPDSDDEFLLEDFAHDADLGGDGDDSDDEDATAAANGLDEMVQILYCSRTHSQLAQFVDEVKKSPFGEHVRVVSLGSRGSLCVNDAVRQLSSVARMNDKCKDLQTKRGSGSSGGPASASASAPAAASGGCPFMHQKRVELLSDRILTEVQDIEQVVNLGRRAKACSYYASRKATNLAQVIAMPYNMLVHKGTREAVGINLQNSIAIVDEAHNLIETIESIHSASVSGLELQRACAQLGEYRERYKKRLSPKNLVKVDQILSVLRSVTRYLEKKIAERKSAKEWSFVMNVNDFLHQARIDNVNLFHLQAYFERSQISKKLNGFALKHVESVQLRNGAEYVSKHVSALRIVESFFEGLTNADKDGRIVINCDPVCITKSTIKFLLLNSSVYFGEVLTQCRAVIVAGGTMAPIPDFVARIVAKDLPKPVPISVFTCGHVVPAHHLLPLAVCQGPSGIPLNFSFKNRADPHLGPTLMKELGQMVLNFCNVAPDGMVLFLPSYDYEQKLYEAWSQLGILAKLEAKKKVFREPHEVGAVDAILEAYGRCIAEGKRGSLLLSVVGGKLSEGINFKDELGRCIIMVGLPFANSHSAELKEKMEYLKSLEATSPRPSPAKSSRDAGSEYYENLCMRAVNQSIGRAIRHQNDYASIMLIDERYALPRIGRKLSGWIRDHVRPCNTFGPCIRNMRTFFKGHAAAAAAAAAASNA